MDASPHHDSIWLRQKGDHVLQVISAQLKVTYVENHSYNTETFQMLLSLLLVFDELQVLMAQRFNNKFHIPVNEVAGASQELENDMTCVLVSGSVQIIQNVQRSLLYGAFSSMK